ncbi:MAG: NGG1p interacting factor NIF3 [Candidatus Omnitrophota bacterium]
MKLKDVYDLLIKKGIEADPRGVELVKRSLHRTNVEYGKLSEKDKKEFDLETLTNPYADTRILYGDPKREIKKILVGIDMETAELVMADRLNERKAHIDLVMAHHPEGMALAGLYQVMNIQTDILNRAGVSITVAEGIMRERITEVERGLSPINHTRSVDAARLFDIPFLCCHTPADNCVATYLTRLTEKKGCESVGDIMDILREIPEYRDAAAQKAPPKIIKGDRAARSGKIFVDMTGGTEGSKDMFTKLVDAGVGTLICMHLSERHFEKAKTELMNIVVAGHIASDNLGVNLILDEIQKKEKISIVPCSGFRRFER